MDDSDVVARIPDDLNMIGSQVSGKKKIMKAKDLEKYFGALKDSEILDEMRAQILRIREFQD
jgi:hypothetical protein